MLCIASRFFLYFTHYRTTNKGNKGKSRVLGQVQAFVAKRRRIIRVIQPLSIQPRPLGCRKLKGYDDVYRIRMGDYRILYSLNETQITIVVLKIGRRKDVYR